MVSNKDALAMKEKINKLTEERDRLLSQAMTKDATFDYLQERVKTLEAENKKLRIYVEDVKTAAESLNNAAAILNNINKEV